MAGAGESGLPKWAEPYLPDFERILHAIEMSDGFVLFPIEVPSFDVAAALAKWLDRNAHPCLFISDDRGDWAQGLLSEKPADGGVALMFGREGDPEMEKSLHLLNQRRDTLAKNLSAPLLWCGSRKFLDSTWRFAPDLWSVADVPRRLLQGALPAPSTRVGPIFGEAVYVDDAMKRSLDELYAAARKQGDPANTTRIGMIIAQMYFAQLDLASARGLLDELEGLLGDRMPKLRARILDLEATLALLDDAAARAGEDAGDRLEEAEAVHADALAAYDRGAGDPRSEVGRANVLLAQGALFARTYRFREAERNYTRALAIYDKLAVPLGKANAHLACGRLYTTLERYDEARQSYEAALQILQKSGLSRWIDTLTRELETLPPS